MEGLSINPTNCGFCFSCYKFIAKKVSVCSKCKLAKYCDINCQKDDWKRHKPFCGLIEIDIQSMRRQAFEPHLAKAKAKLEAVTSGGKQPALIKINSGSIIADSESIKIKTIKTDKILQQIYPNGFVNGTYVIEINRGLLITLVKAHRHVSTINDIDTVSWLVETDGTNLLANLETNIKIASAINSCKPLAQKFKAGEFTDNFFDLNGNLDVNKFE
jgi:hypothetical protein